MNMKVVQLSDLVGIDDDPGVGPHPFERVLDVDEIEATAAILQKDGPESELLSMTSRRALNDYYFVWRGFVSGNSTMNSLHC